MCELKSVGSVFCPLVSFVDTIINLLISRYKVLLNIFDCSHLSFKVELCSIELFDCFVIEIFQLFKYARICGFMPDLLQFSRLRKIIVMGYLF
jgi:hypothetical protein